MTEMRQIFCEAIRLPISSETAIAAAMGSKFGCLANHIVVLQDHKRLPARFFARVSGALCDRLS
jgi:hypothetical protein